MERLTYDGCYCEIVACREEPCNYPDVSCIQRKVWERLKAYEDIGWTPEDVSIAREDLNNYLRATVRVGPARLQELSKADKEGRAVVLPCRTGYPLYVLGLGVEEWNILYPSLSYTKAPGGEVSTIPIGILHSSIGKTAFLNREEAEAALERQKGERDG